jgi:glycerol-3-phosphate dehydrogenase
VDFALGAAGAATQPSVTKNIPLAGAVGLRAAESELRALCEGFDWDAPLTEHLLHRYGANIRDIAAICEADPPMAITLEAAAAYLGAEIVYAITHEGALHLDDIMLRRTRLGFEYEAHALAALDEVSAIAAAQLGWTRRQRQAEVDAYRDAAAAEAAAALEPDDADASRIRSAVPGLVPMSTERADA